MTRLYRVDDVAQQLRLGRATVYRLIARGVLPTVKIGRSRRVAEEDLHAFIEALRTGRHADESSFEQARDERSFGRGGRGGRTAQAR